METTVIFTDNFEEGFYPQDDIGELTVPVGWKVAWVEDPREGYWDRPECKSSEHPWQGKYSASIATRFATHKAAFYRQVEVVEDRYHILSAMVRYFSSGGGIAMKAGIDPTGGIDFKAGEVAWGDWVSQDAYPEWDGSGWKTATARATSLSNTITLFLMSECRFRANNNVSFWDGVRLLGDAISPSPDARWGTLAEALEDIASRIQELIKELGHDQK